MAADYAAWKSAGTEARREIRAAALAAAQDDHTIGAVSADWTDGEVFRQFKNYKQRRGGR